MWWFCHVGKGAKGFEVVDGTWRGRKYLWRKLVVVGHNWVGGSKYIRKVGKTNRPKNKTAVMVT